MLDRPVAGTSWQSARTPNPRGHADREDAMVRAEGAGAHLYDHLDGAGAALRVKAERFGNQCEGVEKALERLEKAVSECVDIMA